MKLYTPRYSNNNYTVYRAKFHLAGVNGRFACLQVFYNNITLWKLAYAVNAHQLRVNRP